MRLLDEHAALPLHELEKYRQAEREASERFFQARQPQTDAERAAVRELGDRIGISRVHQVALELCNEATPDAGFTHGPHAAALVPCPQCSDGLDEGEYCEWCCGVQRVTHRVAKAMSDLGR